MVQEPWASGWIMFSFDFWIFVTGIFSFGGHMNTYRMVCLGRGAFELCLPSLGNFLTKLTLRFAVLGHACRMTKVWVGSGQSPLANTMPWRPYMYRPSHAHRKITISQNITCRFICVYIWRRLVSVGKGCRAAVGSEFTNPYHIVRQ